MSREYDPARGDIRRFEDLPISQRCAVLTYPATWQNSKDGLRRTVTWPEEFCRWV